MLFTSDPILWITSAGNVLWLPFGTEKWASSTWDMSFRQRQTTCLLVVLCFLLFYIYFFLFYDLSFFYWSKNVFLRYNCIPLGANLCIIYGYVLLVYRKGKQLSFVKIPMGFTLWRPWLIHEEIHKIVGGYGKA